MPDLDLDPSSYKERKPKGWRWRLPWSHPQDTKLPMVLFFACVAALAYFFLNLPEGTDWRVCAGIAVIATGAGGMFMLWLGRD